MLSVGLYITAYNYPLVYPLLAEAKEDKEKWASSLVFKQRFEHYLQTAPFYYHSVRFLFIQVWVY